MFNLMIQVLTKKFFSTKGRASRKEYIAFFLFFEILIILPYLWILDNYTSPSTIGVLILLLGFVIIIVHLFAYTTLTVRRLHDCNLKGWWVMLHFILSPLIFLIFLFIKGTKGSNRFGDEPKH